MKKPFRISISNPCSVPWEEMESVPCGRFCSVCNKAVTDFTKFSDEEFIAYFRKGKQPGACGKFTQRQLSITIVPEQYTWPPLRKLARFAAALGLLTGTVSASVKAQDRKAAIVQNPSHQEQEAAIVPLTDTPAIYGTVIDESGNPVPGATVVLRNTYIGTTTDLDGKFSFQPPENSDTYKIVVKVMGLKGQNVTAKANNAVVIKMENIEEKVEMEVYGGM